jgi:hypothetical protein
MFSADASSRKGVTFPTNVYQISYFDETTFGTESCHVLVGIAVNNALQGNVTVLHDDTNGLLHAERVFLERGVAVDGAVEGEAQAIIRGRGGYP